MVFSLGAVFLQGQTLIGNLTFLGVNFTLFSSNIGPFDVTILDKLINALFESGIVPAINDILKKGFPLPVVPGLTFVNPNVAYNNHYLSVKTISGNTIQTS